MAADFAQRRLQMVEQQLAARGIRDEVVLEAMNCVPRELFAGHSSDPYADAAQGIGSGQTISQPYVVARMTELLQVGPGTTVLELGTGSGYQAAVLAEIGCRVYSIERHAELAESARQSLTAAGYDDIEIQVGDGTRGWQGEPSRFDRILSTAAAPEAPVKLLRRQLIDNGRAVLPIGTRDDQNLVVIDRRGEHFIQTLLEPVVFVPLVGEEGWQSG